MTDALHEAQLDQPMIEWIPQWLASRRWGPYLDNVRYTRLDSGTVALALGAELK